MSEIKFSKNYSDHNVNSGANAGFRFEFNCERCSDAWRTDFVAFRTAQASSWLGRAAGFLGGVIPEVIDHTSPGRSAEPNGKACARLREPGFTFT